MNNNQHKYLEVKDHSVSGETFQLIPVGKEGMLKTEPQPKPENLQNYYKSEDYISHTDGKRNLFERCYHFVKSIALRRKLKLINRFNFKDKQLLDVGCGTGDFLQLALNNGWSISGIEPNEKARALANVKTKDSVFDGDYLKKLPDHYFDVITLWHVLEHLPNLEEHIVQLKKLLKPNGRIVIAVPNYKSFDAEYYNSFWAAYDVPRHLWHFSQKSIEAIFKNHDLILENTTPMLFDAFYVSLLSEKYKSGAMNPVKAFWIGLRSNLKAKHSGEYSSFIYTFKNA